MSLDPSLPVANLWPVVPARICIWPRYLWGGLLKHLRQMLVANAAMEENIDWSVGLTERAVPRAGAAIHNCSVANILVLRGGGWHEADVSEPSFFLACSMGWALNWREVVARCEPWQCIGRPPSPGFLIARRRDPVPKPRPVGRRCLPSLHSAKNDFSARLGRHSASGHCTSRGQWSRCCGLGARPSSTAMPSLHHCCQMLSHLCRRSNSSSIVQAACSSHAHISTSTQDTASRPR